MYRVYQDGKLLKKVGKYDNYDDARNAARRFIRASFYWNGGRYNPPIGEFGISIKAV